MVHSFGRRWITGVAGLAASLSVSGCGSDEATHAGLDGGTSGSAGTSGMGAGGGSSGGGAAAGGSSSGGASAGGASAGGACSSVSFHINRGGPPPGSDFCSGPPNCMSGEGFSVSDGQGTTLTIGLACGMSDCSTCISSPCPPGSCHFSSPVPANGIDIQWDGREYQRQTGCGSGAPGVPAVACYAAHCAPPGHYVARMCAYALPPNSDGGSQVCELHAASTPTCVDIPFDYPATATITGALDPRK